MKVVPVCSPRILDLIFLLVTTKNKVLQTIDDFKKNAGKVVPSGEIPSSSINAV